MPDLEQLEPEFSRLLQQAAFDDKSRPEHGRALREQVLAAFEPENLPIGAPSWWKRAVRTGRETMRRPIPRLIAASAALATIAAVWLFVPGQQPPAQAFNKFAAAVVGARTARFQMEVHIEGQPRQKFQAYFLAPGKYRQELPGNYNVIDFKAGKIVAVTPDQKKVMVMNLKGGGEADPADPHDTDYFEKLRELLSRRGEKKPGHYRRIGEKEINGKRAAGFELDSPAAKVTLWGDPTTEAPVRIDSVWSVIPKAEVSMTDFEINVPLDPSLFDPTPPAGYQVQSIDVDASKLSEKDLVEALKSTSAMNEGTFPDSIDTAGIMKLVVKSALARVKGQDEKDFTDGDMQELMKQSITLGRGFAFALQLPESAGARYAGEGVKHGEKDRPVFWYQPGAGKAWRVIYADLTGGDTQTAPQIESAQRLQKAP